MVRWITSRFTASLADSYSLWPLALGKYKGFSSSFLPCAMCCENCSTPYLITALSLYSVFSEWYCIAKCAAKLGFYEANRHLYHKVM